ncbi:hypothetical protein ACN9US_08890 [Staphylococcus caprae]|uniref:hypothetical protein n=1 Tax=Staphylococcus caprae TaxID=29380 RepID=UPI003B222BC5
MNDWKINNYSNQKFLIQKNDNDISIVEPIDNGSFKILAEFNLSNENYVNTYDDNLYISVKNENEEISIFDKK